MKNDIKIAVIIVNYKTAELVINCIGSLWTETANYSNMQIIVVDNASGDSSKERLDAEIKNRGWASRITVLAEDKNLGFAAGNNAGLKHVLKTDPDTDYFWLLNPDTIVRSGALEALVEHMNASPASGIAGSAMFGPNGAVQPSAYNFYSPIGEIWESGLVMRMTNKLFSKYIISPPFKNVPHECDWLVGASLFVRKAVFDSIGLLDDGYFLCFEDVDFCYRAKRAGWAVWYLPESRIMHFGGISTIHSKTYRKPVYWHDSRRRLFIKFYGLSGLFLADLCRSFGIIAIFMISLFNIAKRSLVGLGRLWFFDIRGLLGGRPKYRDGSVKK